MEYIRNWDGTDSWGENSYDEMESYVGDRVETSESVDIPQQGSQDNIYGQELPFYGEEEGREGTNWYQNDFPSNDYGSGNMGAIQSEVEPPLLEELGINFTHIFKNTIAIINPLKGTDISVLNDNDITGPALFCLYLGAILLFSGKVHFGVVYGVFAVGILAVYVLLNLMSSQYVEAASVASIVGYNLLPVIIVVPILSIFGLG